jgi:hypothetical protein
VDASGSGQRPEGGSCEQSNEPSARKILD